MGALPHQGPRRKDYQVKSEIENPFTSVAKFKHFHHMDFYWNSAKFDSFIPLIWQCNFECDSARREVVVEVVDSVELTVLNWQCWVDSVKFESVNSTVPLQRFWTWTTCYCL